MIKFHKDKCMEQMGSDQRTYKRSRGADFPIRPLKTNIFWVSFRQDINVPGTFNNAWIRDPYSPEVYTHPFRA